MNSKLTIDQPQGFSITLVSDLIPAEPFIISASRRARLFHPWRCRWGLRRNRPVVLACDSRVDSLGAAANQSQRRRHHRDRIERFNPRVDQGSRYAGGLESTECKDKRRPLFGETLVTPWHNEKGAAKDHPRFVWALGSPTLPDKQGDFTLRNLAPGQYRFNARPMVRYWYLKSISWQSSSSASPKENPGNSASRRRARNWTTLKAGDRMSGLTIVLAEGAASLQGQIEVAEGQSLPSRMFVYLVPAERENLMMSCGSSLPLFRLMERLR